MEPPQIGVDPTPFLALIAAVRESKPGDVKSPRRIFEEWVDYGSKLIEGWDVRMVPKLIELFPSAVPKSWFGRRMRAEMNEKGEWIVFPL
jgi:hypothetical protein